MHVDEQPAVMELLVDDAARAVRKTGGDPVPYPWLSEVIQFDTAKVDKSRGADVALKHYWCERDLGALGYSRARG